MGLQSQLNDVASDSIPILLLALIATAVSHLRSLVASVCHSVTTHRRHHHDHHIDAGLGSGLAGLIALSEQLSLNSAASFRYLGSGDDGGDGSPCCVFCLSGLRDGDLVRRLDCRHVFHKDCLDGWIDQMKFNCPLCRSPLVTQWRVNQTERRVAGELASWFSVR